MKKYIVVLIIFVIAILFLNYLYAIGVPNKPMIVKEIKQITVTANSQLVNFTYPGYRDISTDAILYLDEAGTTANASDRKLPANTLYDSECYFTEAQNWKVISDTGTANVVIKVYDFLY
jgi:hypothetical protein